MKQFRMDTEKYRNFSVHTKRYNKFYLNIRDILNGKILLYKDYKYLEYMRCDFWTYGRYGRGGNETYPLYLIEGNILKPNQFVGMHTHIIGAFEQFKVLTDEGMVIYKSGGILKWE